MTSYHSIIEWVGLGFETDPATAHVQKVISLLCKLALIVVHLMLIL